MADITERLRNDVSLFSRLGWQEHVALAREAADEIERLRASRYDLLAAARRALRIFRAQGESTRPNNVLGALDAAIAKAEGRS